jgi:hypothetical protein
MAYYKYLKKEFLRGMLNNGTLRIGTLYDFRTQEGKEIRDENEGKAVETEIIAGEKKTYKTVNDLPEKLTKYITGNNIFDVTVGNWTMHTPREAEDVYIFCLTKDADKQKMQNFGYDACVEILDIVKFSVVMAVELFLNGKIKYPFTTGGDCIYNERKFSALDPAESSKIFRLKEPKYAHHNEYRIVMQPTDGSEIKPFNFDFPDLRDCLRSLNI